ncbi:hypothetical protein SNE40_003896 [Patella caerulea]|uniref:Uncharacterized protein n=1 Tax=Patella caerulea TaxID=87958 RepID=A0AAN8K8Y3_PATCE
MFYILETRYLVLYQKDVEFCLTGDFNARTASSQDIDNQIVDDISNQPLDDLMEVVLEERRVMEQYFDDSRKCTAGRRSEDKILNRYGERLNELSSNVGLYCLNGRCGQDINLGKFTCNETSVVDYCICSPKVLPCIEDFYVNDFNSLLSDKHNAVCYEIRKRENKHQLTRAVEETVTNVTKVRWKDDLHWPEDSSAFPCHFNGPGT